MAQMRHRNRMVALVVLTSVITTILGASQPASGVSGYLYAGHRTGGYFTGVWGWIQNEHVQLNYTTSHTARWMGKTILDAQGNTEQWLQAGNCIGSCGDEVWGTKTSYLEYRDYALSYNFVSFGDPSETYTQYSVWGDGTGGVDGIGTYYNTHVTYKSGPGGSPVWGTRLRENWSFNDAFGEVFNSTQVNEPMGAACFGCHSAGSYFGLGWYSSGSTTWSLWSTSNDTPFTWDDTPYYRDVTSQYYRWTPRGP